RRSPMRATESAANATVRGKLLARTPEPRHGGWRQRSWATVEPMAPAPSMQPPIPRNRMLLMVLAMGGIVGLHLGLLHLFLWRNPAAPLTFVVCAIVFSLVAYALQRWVFPRLPDRSFGVQVACELLVSTLVFSVISVVAASAVAMLLGAPAIFGIPTGTDEHI